MKIKKHNHAFTLIELLVVITIIAILAGIALPVFSNVQTKGAQIKCLSNAKQIALACKLYAGDHNGNYPRYTDDTTTPATPPLTSALTDSNSVFVSLFTGGYISDESIFWNTKSTGYCAKSPPDNKPTANGGVTLDKGENCWGYVAGLSDTSNSRFPLIVDGTPAKATTAYATDNGAIGGVWSGKQAIVIRADTSGTVEQLYPKNHTVKRDDDVTKDALQVDSSAAWLTGDVQFLDPKPNS